MNGLQAIRVDLDDAGALRISVSRIG